MSMNHLGIQNADKSDHYSYRQNGLFYSMLYGGLCFELLLADCTFMGFDSLKMWQEMRERERD